MGSVANTTCSPCRRKVQSEQHIHKRNEIRRPLLTSSQLLHERGLQIQTIFSVGNVLLSGGPCCHCTINFLLKFFAYSSTSTSPRSTSNTIWPLGHSLYLLPQSFPSYLPCWYLISIEWSDGGWRSLCRTVTYNIQTFLVVDSLLDKCVN